LPFAGGVSSRPAAAARSGRTSSTLAFETDRSGDADVVVATAPSGARPVTTATAEDIQPAVSPEGRVAFASDRDGNYDIFVTGQGGGGERTQLTRDKAPDYAPAWAPESGWLAFVSERRGSADIFVIPASGSGIAVPVTTSRADDRDPAWSPHGLTIAFASDRAGSYDIWLVGLGQKPRRLTSSSAADFEPAWSPDGSKLAFTRRNRHGNYDVYSLNLHNGITRRLTDDPGEDSEPSWSPDGKQIAFTSNRNGDYDVYVMNANGTDEEDFSNNPAPFDLAPSWKPEAVAAIARWVSGGRIAAESPAAPHRHADTVVTCTIEGDERNNVLYGTGSDDVLCGHGGNDTIYGGGGNDIIIGGPGRDRLYGGSGKDEFVARDGYRDFLRGGTGLDRARTDGRKIDRQVFIEGPL
jgi:Tol biopolymer transport system component